MIAIIKKELRGYFTQMTGYIFMALMIFFTALYFVIINVFTLSPDYQHVLGNSTILFLVMIPTITMRLFAEEQKNRTDQLLFTSPLTITQIVAGKYFAASLLFVFAVVMTMLFPFMLAQYGDVPVNQIIGAYIGYTLMGMSLIAIGLFISVLTNNQIIAAVATFAAIFVVIVMDVIAGAFPMDTQSSLVFALLLVLGAGLIWHNATKHTRSAVALVVAGLAVAAGLYLHNNLLFDGLILRVLRWLSVFARFTNLANGVLNIADIVYYISLSALFVYFAINTIQKRRWR